MDETRWRLTVDQKACINSGLCAATAPGRFVHHSAGSTPVTEEVLPDDAVLEAAEGCPVEAIRVFDNASDVVLAPEGL